MPKNDAILKDIKKLFDLGVSEEEIILNLKEVGIKQEEAEQLVDQVKSQSSSVQEEMQILTDALPAKKKPSIDLVVEHPTYSQDADQEQQERQQEVEEELDKKFKKIEEQAEKPKKGSKKIERIEKPIERISSQDVWMKGIITTINAKLGEIEKIQNEIESVVDERIEKAMQKEREKIKVLMESKQQLLSSNIDSRMNESIKSVNEKLQRTESGKKLSEETLAQINFKLEEMNKLKAKFLEQTVNDSTKQQGDVKKLLENSKRELDEMQDRLDKSLELMTRLTEGLVESSEQKFNELWEEKEKETNKKIEKLLNMTDTSFLEGKIKEASSQYLKELRKEMDELKLAMFEDIEKEKSAESITKQIDEKISELEGFKKQFLTVIERNTASTQKARDQMFSELEEAKKQMLVKGKAVDDKIAELEAFEKTFAEEMGIAIDKVKEKKAKKKK
ncbi:MAG: hypothetical protein Q7S21_05840 [archaeon]|nr:hypothetical protein [archaeon]